MSKMDRSVVDTPGKIGLFDPGCAPETRQEVEADLNWRYLTTELERIDLLIQRQVNLWQLAGQDPQDDLRGLYLTDQEINSLTKRPFASHWGHLVEPRQTNQDFSRQMEELNQQSLEILAEAAKQDIQLRLAHLIQVFQLDQFEVNILLICLASVLDLRYEKIYAYLQDDVTRKRPSINLVLDLLCPAGQARFQSWNYFYPHTPLFKFHLVSTVSESQNSPLLNQVLYLDNHIAAWLLGQDQFRSDSLVYTPLADIASQIEKHHSILNEVDLPALNQDLTPVLVFYGADQRQQDFYAHQVAKSRKQSLLELRLETIIRDGISIFSAVRLALRDAMLLNAILYITGWDTAMDAENAPDPELLQEICEHCGLVILAGKTHWVAKGFPRERNLLWLETHLPAYAERLQLWRQFLGRKPVQEPVHWIGLAGQFQLSTAQIRDACASAWDAANQRNSPVLNTDLFAAARAHSNPNLSHLARKINPRYTWQDLILPPDQLQILKEIVATVLGRPLVLDEWGLADKLASSRGVTVLFAGSPGTGKTMAAEVISAELGLDLYKIDLSTVISKYIGETEKNLEQIFAEAETSNAILFFDEADALFGKRSEVRDSHDRYANIEISYLLQRMEAYDGVTILATNLRANLDEAFKRRLQFAVDFPFPEEIDRLRIWQTLFPKNAPFDKDIDLALMARRFRLAGGNIRNILVSAAYLAAADGGQLGMSHLLHGAKRELQKMGRLVDEPGLFSVENLKSG